MVIHRWVPTWTKGTDGAARKMEVVKKIAFTIMETLVADIMVE
jgi:hypothetical protein